MYVFYSPSHQDHQPPFEIFNGEQTPHQEVPMRVERILTALQRTQHQVLEGTIAESETEKLDSILRKIHTPEYLSFLTASQQFEGQYLYPSVFPYRSESSFPLHPVAQRGQFCFDLYTPLNNTTNGVARNSAFVALRAAQAVVTTGAPHYALCRPPGHHAEPSKMGGYCYYNNGAVAAECFLQANTLNKVAVLDVDFHHGNGTEKIFGESDQVLTVSIHADPAEKFPYFSGQITDAYASNHNFPLPLGITNTQYQAVLEQALREIRKFEATHLVVCFGADTHQSDPIGGFKLTTEYFTQMALTIAALQLPTVIVQEGGYNTAALGKNVVAFLAGF